MKTPDSETRARVWKFPVVQKILDVGVATCIRLLCYALLESWNFAILNHFK
jgi:hypothetical protein